MTVLFGNMGLLSQQPSLIPITSLVQASVNYGNIINETFTAANQSIGQRFSRSNGGSAMTDTLPNPLVNQGGIGPLPNGWWIVIDNNDASAAITVSPPTGITINGSSSLSIPAGSVANIITDGSVYYAEVTQQNSSAALAATAVGFGSAGGFLTGNATNFNWTNSTNKLTISGANAKINLDDGAGSTIIGSTSASGSGANNTLIGNGAGNSLTTSTDTTCVGVSAGQSITTATANTFVGYQSGTLCSGAGNWNTAIGTQSGSTLTTGAFNTFLGAQADTTLATAQFSIALGYNTKVTASNQLSIGSSTGGQGITTQLTVGAAGAAAALPASPTVYATIRWNGVNYVLPLFAPA